jgi:hypothetical protein
MVKKAIILSGHMRTFSMIKSYFDFTNTDIYIHTYDILGYWSDTETVNSQTEEVTEEKIFNYFNEEERKNIKKIIIEHQNSKQKEIFVFSKAMEHRKLYYARPYNFVSMHMKRLSALEMFFEHKNTEYDIVYLLRPDSIFHFFNKFDMEKIKNNQIFIEWNENPNWLGDIFFVSNEKQMLHLKNIYIESFFQYIYSHTEYFDPHTYFYYLIHTYFMSYQLVNNGGNLSLINTPSGYCQK